MQVTFRELCRYSATDQDGCAGSYSYRRFNFILGNPDGGKSTAAIDLISRVTRGDDFPMAIITLIRLTVF